LDASSMDMSSAWTVVEDVGRDKGIGWGKFDVEL